MLDGQLSADALANHLNLAVGDNRVGTSEVYVFKDTALRLGLCEGAGVDAVFVDANDLAGGDLAHELSADDVQRAGLGGEDPAVPELTQDEGPNTVTVAGGPELLLGHQNQAEGPGQPRQDFREPRVNVVAVAG